MMKDKLSPFSGFSKLTRDERLNRLLEAGALSPKDIALLNHATDKNLIDVADNLIENVIGCFPLPLGIAMHFMIDGKERFIPMAVEESSIIAAASGTAKWVREHGNIITSCEGDEIIGQIQFPKINNFKAFKKTLLAHHDVLIDLANKHVTANFVKRGGGVTAITVREIKREDGHIMGVLHVMLHPCDAMGANIVTQVCEYLKDPIAELTGEKAALCIVSNLVDTKITQAQIILQDIDPQLGNAIEEASLFANLDPYRAATSNKGVLNGIDGLLIATGNDWRAAESGIHAYAARDGQYRSITQWKMHDKNLVGTFEAPLIVGTVGGVTKLHPMAQLCLKLLDVQDAKTLSRIAAAVGLVQNLGALRALVSDGIIAGHMRLHLSNLMMGTDATATEMTALKIQLEKQLKENKKITQADAIRALEKMRAAKME